MKGRTKCPDCKHEFVLDIPADKKKHEAVCPKCEKKFTILTSDSDKDSGEQFFWEEYGEPRKTILSSKKPHTKKPQIVAIILVCVFIIGISTAAFSEVFIESSMEVASSIGLKSDVEIHLINQTNISINSANVSIEGVGNLKKAGNGSFIAKEVEVGIKKVEISSQGYNSITREILVAPIFTSYTEIKLSKGNKEITNEFDNASCSIILVIFSIFALLGAIACYKRKHFDLAIIGCLISIFSFGFFMIGSILSIIAFILVMKSREEFDNGKKGKVF